MGAPRDGDLHGAIGAPRDGDLHGNRHGAINARHALRVRGFRNLADADLELPDAGCVIVGRNGHGKTSLIEALLYPLVFRSFRGAGDRELVQFGADGFRVETELGGAVGSGARSPQAFADGGERNGGVVAAGFDGRTGLKKVTVNGLEPERLADAIGMVRGVVLSPGDVALVAGGPRERRRYLDVQLSLTVPGYVEALGRYRRALAQRARAAPRDAEPWEEVAAEHGAAIVAARRGWAERWSVAWAGHCVAIGETGTPRLSYAPRTEGGVRELRAALAQGRERDRALGRTGAGPHRDDLRLTRDGRSLRSYGSAGQQRTAALALRLIEAEAMEDAGGALLCLDDAFAELDAERSRRLAELIATRARAASRIVAAVPKEADVPDVIGALPRWAVIEGRVTT